MKRKWLNCMTFIALLGILVGCTTNQPQDSAVSEDGQSREATATITTQWTIETSDGEQKTFEAQSESGATVLDVLKANAEVVEEDGFVQAIDGHAQGDNQYWMYEVDGELAQVGAGDFILEDQQSVTWRLESFDE